MEAALNTITTVKAKGKCHIQMINNLFKPLLPFEDLVSVFLHGSYADGTNNAFSDIDDFVIIDDLKATQKEIQEIQTILEEIDLAFCKIDPIQHHGHWIRYSSQITFYDNSYMPLLIIPESMSVIGSDSVSAKINIAHTNSGLINNVRNMSRSIRELIQMHEKNNLNIFHLKCLAGSFALMPAYLFQLLGCDYDKPTSISRAGEIFSDSSLALIQWATDIRNRFHILTESKAYVEFSKSIDSFNDANKWRLYAQQNAPLLNYNKLSDISICKEHVELFLKESWKIVDQASIIHKEQKDYELALKELELFCIDIGVEAFGQFGEVKEPGVSDLDVFICIKDEGVKDKQKKILEFIWEDHNRSYTYWHYPTIVPLSCLEIVPYLHTLYGLSLTYTKSNSFNLPKSTPGQHEILNIVWAFSLLPISFHILKTPNDFDVRTILLVLKNLLQSLQNLQKKIGNNHNFMEYSRTIRSSYVNGTISKQELINQFQKFYFKLFNLMDTIDGQKSNSPSLILNRNLIIIPGNKNQLKISGERYSEKFEIYLSKTFFDIIKSFITGKSKDTNIQNYMKAAKIAYNFSQRKGLDYNFVRPFNIDLFHARSTSKIKRVVYRILSYLPYSMIKKIL